MEGAYLSCLRETEAGLFIRLYNPAQTRSACRLTLPAACESAVFTDGLGRPLPDARPMKGPDIVLALGPNKVQGLLCRAK